MINIVGQRLVGETNDNGRIQRTLDASVGGTCKIPSGIYYIYPLGVNENHHGLNIPSNINIEMEYDTILQCIPQSTNRFSVITIFNVENVTITGGQIVGDRYDHTGHSGEHGMGINIYHSKNITIDNVGFKDHWGDCIYIGGNNMDGQERIPPQQINIKNCSIDNSRRQGISITICDGVTIENCRITNINGTSPQYGIDIETNVSSIPCKNVTVKGCYFAGSVGGGFVIGNSSENVSVDNCIFDGDNINISKSNNSKVTNCTLNKADVNIRSSVGVIVAHNIFNSSGVVITTNSDITRNISITSNIFQNIYLNTNKKGIALVGNDNGCFGLNICGNSFYNYISETLYFYTISNGTSITNNIIKTNQVGRWALYLKGKDMKFSGNNVIIDLTTHATLNNIINLTGVRGSFDSNTIRSDNLTIGEAIITAGSINGEKIGMTISNNIVHSNDCKNMIKFSSVSDTKYKVLNNDFGCMREAFVNASGHFIKGNV